MNTYLVIKALHILSSVLMVGTGFGTAFYLFFANRTRSVPAIAAVSRLVVRADWWFTTPAVIFQPASGLWLAHTAGWPWDTPWLMASIALYAIAGACWLPVVWLQVELAAMAKLAHANGDAALPERYWRYAKRWELLGYPAFFAMLTVYFLMVLADVSALPPLRRSGVVAQRRAVDRFMKHATGNKKECESWNQMNWCCTSTDDVRCAWRRSGVSGRDARHRLAFVDIAEPGFDPAPLGVDLPALNRELHARLPDGRMLTGLDSILAAQALTGRRWVVRLLRVPVVRGALAPLYRRFARNRHAASRWLGYRAEAPCDAAACREGSERAAEHPTDRPARDNVRRIVVTWMYGAAIAHLLVGIAVPWVAGAPWLDAYHRVIELHFWTGTAPDPARAQQIWWMSLMGATVQCASVWMLALVHLGNRLQKREVWGWLLAGLLIWAPQDMLFSLQAQVSGHVAIDAAALVAMVPPLVWLWRRDAV